MELIQNINDIRKPFRNAVITIGNFDGVHLGHQALFRQVVKKARELAGTSIAMTFEPHPIRVLNGNDYPPLITLYEQKVELIAKSDLDVLICIPFTQEVASIMPKEFVEDILLKRIGMKAIVVGGDYAFGKNREGNLDLLKRYAGDHGFEVIVADWIKISETLPRRISSTKIRGLIIDGKVEDASKLLGRHYQIRGSVVTGRNRGAKSLGFPTANIKLNDELCPKMGVYAVTVELGDRAYNGVANIGYSPTFNDRIFTVEVHVLDFNQDIYGYKIRVNFIKRIRNEKKFSNIEQLSRQIKKDISKAREILVGQ